MDKNYKNIKSNLALISKALLIVFLSAIDCRFANAQSDRHAKIGMNIGGIGPGNCGYMFKDAFKMSSFWTIYGTGSADPNQEDGDSRTAILPIDANGWPNAGIPYNVGTYSGKNYGNLTVGNVCNGPYNCLDYPVGDYYVFWEGSGQLSFTQLASGVVNTAGTFGTMTAPGVMVAGLGVSVSGSNVSSTAISGTHYCRIKVSSRPYGQGIFTQILQSLPSPNHIKNINIVYPNTDPSLGGADAFADPNNPSYYLKKPFHPKFIYYIDPFPTSRFMDFMGTNSVAFNTEQSWTKRKPATYYTQATGTDGDRVGNSPAFEYIIRMSNETQMDPWINIPVCADNDFFLNMAQLFKDSLNPGLHLYLELGNEVWNFGAPFHCFFVMQTIATTQPQYGGNWSLAMADREATMWKSFHDVFNTESFRIHGVLMGQSCCTNVVNGRMAQHKAWGTDKYYDYFGMTWYYDIPGYPDGSAKPYPSLVSPSQVNDIDQALIAQDRNVVGSNAWQMNEHAKLAKVYGKRICYYEGGKFGWELKSGHNFELSKQDPTIRRNYRQILDTINSFPQTDLVMHYADFGGFSYWSDLSIPLNYYGSMPSAFEDTTSVGNIYLTGMPFTGTGGNYTVAGTNKHAVWKELVANLPTPQDETPVVSDTIAAGLSMKFASPFRDSYANVLGAAKPDALTDNFTLEAWIKSKRSNLIQDIVAYSNSIDGNSNNTIRINDQNQLEWIITDRYGATQLDLIGPIINLNKWYHIAWSRSATGYKLYVNGTLVQTASLTSGSYAANRLVFGGLQDIFSVINPYFGELDEVRIWNGLEINQLTLRDWMCKVINPSHPQYAYLSNYYPCNTITGTGLYDAKNKAINGFLVNYTNTNGAYAISGAPVGEASINTYPSNWAVASLNYTNPIGNDIFSVYNIGAGNPDGVHIYAVNRPPKFNTIPQFYTGISQKYYGVFMANGDEPTYGVTYIYQGNPAANSSAFYNRLLKRDDYSDSTWINTGADVDEVMKSLSINCQEKERSEYSLGVRFNQLSNRPGSGKALYFDGTASAHMDYFYRADSAYTISFWASPGTGGCTMWLGNAATGRNAMYQSWGDGNYSYRSHGNDLWTVNIQNIFGAANGWNHYVTVKKGDGIFVYVNGVLAVSGTHWWQDTDFNELNLGSPSPYEWSPGYYHGAIDELSVWSTGFSEDEVRSLMCKKITPNHPKYCNLQAYFRFDEGVGNVVENMHGSGDLVLTNTQWVNSQASLGDESVYNYNKPYSVSMAHPDGDKMDFNYLYDNNQDITYGTQMYRVDAAPTGTVPSGIVEYDSSRYWGVYPVTSQTWNKPRFFYSLTYNYGPDRYVNLNQESKIQVLDRNNRGPFNWNNTDYSATQDTVNHRLTIIPTRYTVTGMNFNISATVGTELIVPNHGFQNCDNITFLRSSGGTNPIQSDNSELPTIWDYMVSVVDQNTIRIHYNCCTNPAPCTDPSTAIQFKSIGNSAPLYIQMYNMFRTDEILLGSGTPGTFNLIHDLPATIPGILGSKHVCAGASGLVYKLPKPLDPGTKEYIWSGSAGLSVGISNSDTVLVSIAASLAQSIEYLTVVGVNKFGRSTPPTVLAITVSGTSYLAANIAGPICQNQGQTGVLYSISNVSPTPYSYAWTITSGASMTGFNTGTSIGVDFDTTTNKVTVSVYAVYACGTSLINNAIVNVNTRPRSDLQVTGQAVCSSNAFPYGIIAITGAQAGITYKAYDGSLLVSSATGFGADLQLYVPKSKLLPTGIHKYMTITAEAASCPVAATTLTGVADMLMNDPLSNADLNVSIVGPPGTICAFLGGPLGFVINDFTITVSGTKKDVEYVSILSGYDYLYGAAQTSHVNGSALILNVQPQQYPWFIRYNTPVGIGVRAETPGCGVQIMNSQVQVTFVQGTKVALPTKPMGPGVDAAPWMGNSPACGAYASSYYTTAWGGDQNTFYSRFVSVPVVDPGNVLTFTGPIGATMAVNDVLYLYSSETPPGTYPPGLLTYDVWNGNQKFYVKSINTTTGVFQLSQTLGGVAMNITTSGANLTFWAPVTIDFVAGTDYFTIPARFGPHGLRLYSHIDFKDASNGIPVDLGQFNPAYDGSYQGNDIYYVSSINGNNIQVSNFGLNNVWQKSQPYTVGWGKVNLTNGSTAGSTSTLRLQDYVVLPGTILRDMDENILGVISTVIDQYNFTLKTPFAGTTGAYTYSWMAPAYNFAAGKSVVITTPSDADDNGFDWTFGPQEAIVSVTGNGGIYDPINGTYRLGNTPNTIEGHVKNGITIFWANTFTGNASVGVVAVNSCSRSNANDHLPGQPWYSWTTQSIPITSQIPVIPGVIQGSEVPYCQAPSQTNYSAISPNATGGYEWQLLNGGTSWINDNGRSTITVNWQPGFEGLPTLRVRAIGCDGLAGSAWSSAILTIGGLAAGSPVITGDPSYCKGIQLSNFGTQRGATGILNWALFPTPAPDDIYSSMVAYYPFSNSYVNTATGSSSLGSGATPSVNAGASLVADKNSVSNSAMQLTGNSSVVVDWKDALNFVNKETWAMWINPSDLSSPVNYRVLLWKEHSYRFYITSAGQLVFNIYSDNAGTNIFPIYDIGGGGYSWVTTVAGLPAIPVNTWTHLAFTFANSGTVSTASVFMNGTIVGTITAPGNNLYPSTNWMDDANFGDMKFSNGWGFKGKIDEMVFYKRILSSSNIQTLYNLNANTIALPDMSYAGSIDQLSGTVTWNPTFTGIVNVSANSIGCTDGIPYSYYPVTVLSRPVITNVVTTDPVSCAVGSSGKTLITLTGLTVPFNTRFDADLIGNDLVYEHNSTLSGNNVITINSGITVGTYLEDVTIRQTGSLCASNTYAYDYQVGGNVQPDLNLAVSPKDLFPVCINQTTGITVANSEINTYYQAFTGAGVNIGTTVAGTGATITLGGFAFASGGLYPIHVRASNPACGIYTMTGVATVQVNFPVNAGTVTGPSGTVCNGTSATLTLTGYNGTIQWQINNAGTYQDILGENFNTIILGLQTVGGTFTYRAKVQNTGCSQVATSSGVTLTVNGVGSITGISAASICNTSPMALTLSGYTSGAVRWFTSTNFEVTYSQIPGANSYILSVPGFTFIGLNYYKAEVTFGACAPVTTTSYHIGTQNVGPSGTITGPSSGLCSPSSNVINLTNYNGFIQWVVSNDNINYSPVGANTSTLGININGGLGLSYYKAIVTDLYDPLLCPGTTTSFVITVTSFISAGTMTGYNSVDICQNSPYSLNLTGYSGDRAILQVSNADFISGLIAQYPFDNNAVDVSGNGNNGIPQNSPTYTTDRWGAANKALSLNGSSQFISTPIQLNNPQSFSLSIWFNTTSNQGGKLIGFGNNQTGYSGSYDRHLYMTNSGNVIFGVFNGSTATIQSPSSYNDGNWHHVTATYGANIMNLYIDGVLINTLGGIVASNYIGYWKIGFDNVGGWPNGPASSFINGALDDALIFNKDVSASEVTQIFNAAQGSIFSPMDVTTFSGLTGADVTVPIGPHSLAGTYFYRVMVYNGICSPLTSASYKYIVHSAPGMNLSYPLNAYCNTSVNPIPVYTSFTGGYFGAIPSGLSVNTITGLINLASSSTGSYTVSYNISVNGCGINQRFASVTVNSLPGLSLAYTGSPYCQGAGSGLASITTVAGGYFSASTAGIAFSNTLSGTIDLTLSNSGTYGVIYAASITGCGMVITTTSVTINSIPGISLSYTVSPYCTGAGVANPIYTNLSGGYFSTTASGIKLNTTTGVVDLSLSQAGTYSIRYTASITGCGQISTIAGITINSIPGLSLNYAGNPYCKGTGSGLATITTISGGYFSSSTAGIVFSNTLLGTIDLTLSNSGTYGIVYAASIPGCGIITTTTSVMINSIPGLSLNYTGSPYCIGSGFANPLANSLSGGYFSTTSAGIRLNTITGMVDLSLSQAGTYNIRYTASISGCGQISTVAGIAINSLPGLSLSYPGSPYCQGAGSRIAVYTSVAGGYFSSLAGLSLDASGTIDLSSSASGSYIVSYNVSVAGCGLTSTTGMVTINTIPGISLNYAGSPYCIGSGNAAATYSSVAGGYFSSIAGLNISASNGAINLNTGSNAGTYTVTYNVSVNGCGMVQTSTGVTLNSIPGLSLSYPNSPYCQNSTVSGSPVYISITGGTFNAAPGLSVNAMNGTLDLSASSGGSYTVVYSVSTPGCGISSITGGVVINTAPGLSISYTGGPYCKGSGLAGATYNPVTGAYFTSNPTGLVINASSGTIDLTNSTSGTYTVYYNLSISGCGIVNENNTVSITGLAQAGVIINPGAVCSNTGVVLSTTGTSGNLQWQESMDNMNWNNLSGATASSYSLVLTGLRYYRVTAQQGSCTVVTGSGIMLNPVEAPWISKLSYPHTGSQIEYCAALATTTQIGVNVFSSSAGQYSVNPTGLQIDVNTGSITITAATPARSYMITYSITGGGVCNSISTTTSVMISSPVTSGLSFGYGPNNPICSNTQAALKQLPSVGGSYSLQNPMPGVMLNTATGGIIYNANQSGRQQISINYISNSVCKDKYTYTLTVVGQPTTPSVPDYGNTEFCKTGKKGIVNISNYTSITGIFTSNKISLILNTITGELNAGTSPVGTYGIAFRLNDDGVCVSLSSDSVYVTIKSSQAGTLTADASQTAGICEGDSLHVTLTGNEGTVTWITNTSTITGIAGNMLSLKSTSGDQTVKAVSKKDNCPVATTEYTITASLMSNAGTAKAKESEICNIPNNTQVELKGSVGKVEWQISDDSLGTYSTVETAGAVDLTIPELNKYGIKKYYKAKVTSGTCPTKESNIASVKTCKPDNFVPNALTPNTGDHNSSWNLEKLRLTNKAEIRVFNRYGTEVYYATGDKVHDSWDGGGHSAGTYYYVIKRNEINTGADQKVFSGAVTIIK